MSPGWKGDAVGFWDTVVRLLPERMQGKLGLCVRGWPATRVDTAVIEALFLLDQ